MLGNLALERIDEALERQYPGRYFRYVDDVVIVCKAKESRAVLDVFKSLLQAEGLSINDFKTDLNSREAWFSVFSGRGESPRNAFEEFLFAMEVYLARHPEQIGDVQRTFHSEGFNLPIKRWSAAVSQPRFRTFLFRQLRLRRVMDVIKAFRVGKEDLLPMAQALRPLLWEELHAAVVDIPRAGMARRFRLQRLRYLCNRLIYLTPASEYQRLIDRISEVPEFYEIRVLLRALLNGNATELLMFPGRTVASFVELWREGSPDRPAIQWGKFNPKISIDALATLTLGGLVDPPQTVLAVLNSHQRELLKFCSGATSQPSKDTKESSFVAEVRRLQNSRSHEFVLSALDSRFASAESSGAQLLRMDFSYPNY